MIEDIDLTKRILEYFASDAKWPSNASLQTLYSKFPDESQDSIAYHVYCAESAGLLEANVNQKHTATGVFFTDGWIVGLTQKGGEYVRDSRSSYWNKAQEEIKNAGLEVTTKLMIDMLGRMIRESLGI